MWMNDFVKTAYPNVTTEKELSALRSKVRFYCDEGLLVPDRVVKGKSAYREFDEGDLARLEEIMIYQELGLSLGEMKEIFSDPSYDKNLTLADAIDALHRRIEHLRNLEIVATVALGLGLSIFPLTSFDDEEIDRYAEALRSMEGFIDPHEALEGDGNRDHAMARLRSAVEAFVELKAVLERGDSFAEHANAAREAAQEYWSAIKGNPKASPGEQLLNMLFVHLLGDGIFCELADCVGGGGTSEAIGRICLLLWLDKALREIVPAVLAIRESSNHAKREEAVLNLQEACFENVMSQESASLRIGLDEESSPLWLVEQAFMLIREMCNREMLEYLDAGEIVIPSEEDFDEALRLLRKSIEDG